MRGTRALIHLDNLSHNIREIKRFIADRTALCIAVKANAYGHGAVECAKVAVECGVSFLAVATVEEGLELRNAGITAKILLLSLCHPSEVETAVLHDITPLVFDTEYIARFAEAARSAGKIHYPVHLAVDTGMGRIGCLPHEAAQLARAISDSGVLVQGGTCTHFAVSDSIQPNDRSYTDVQFARFTEAIGAIEAAGLSPGLRHCCNSAATLDRPEFHLDMVRPGIIAYGSYADEVSKEYLSRKGTPIDLKPVMTLCSTVSATRMFEGGKSVGYGRTWTAPATTEIAVLPVGYGDGWLRRFSESDVSVAIDGKPYPLRGRICMDQCMVDLGKASGVRRWDTAVLFGDRTHGALQTADDLARKTGTISYEITSCITSRVPRVYLRQDVRQHRSFEAPFHSGISGLQQPDRKSLSPR